MATRFAKHSGESKYPHLWKGLQGLWLPGNVESLGTDGIRDHSLNNNTGTTAGTMTAADWVLSKPKGQAGYALDFDGTDDRISIPNSGFLAGDFTILAWFNTPTSIQRVIVGEGLATAGVNWMRCVVDTDNTLLFTFDDNSVKKEWSTTGASIDGAWNHMAVTKSNGYISYLDGVADGGETDNGSIDTGDPFTIGRGILGNDWLGQIRIVITYRRALLPNEIKQIYLGASPLTLKRRFVFAPAEAAPPATTTSFLPLLGVG